MEESEKHYPASDSRSGMTSFWAGVVGTPLVWASDLQLKYMLVPWVCHTRRFYVLYLISAVCLSLAAFAGLLCWRDWRRCGGTTPETPEFGTLPRIQFLGALGLLVSAMTFLLILLSAIPGWIIDPCVD
jgi:hypothetical protein